AAFAAAGLDPETASATWPDVIAAARAIKAKIGTPAMGAVKFPITSSWMIWVQLEQYSAIHDLPFATKGNGFDGIDSWVWRRRGFTNTAVVTRSRMRCFIPVRPRLVSVRPLGEGKSPPTPNSNGAPRCCLSIRR